MGIFSPDDLSAAQQRIAASSWAADVLSAIRLRADSWLSCRDPIPNAAGGWMHEYVCPEHWHALIFDPTQPDEHRCLEGDILRGPRYDGAWRVLQHRRIAAAARDLALLAALTSDERYAREASAILLGYTRRYHAFAGDADAPAWMLKGRAFNQALTEALWAMPLAQAFDLLRPRLSPADRALISNQLLRPIIATLAAAQEQLVQHQGKLSSNYNAWLIAALGCLAFALDDRALAERAIDGPAGFRAHLAAAIHSDGFEYEGSPYYHLFVSLAYTLLAEAARANGINLYAVHGPDGQCISMTWRAVAALALPDGSLPLANDGAYWYGSPFDAEIAELFELALARTGDPTYAWLLEQAYRRRNVSRDQWSALVAGTDSIEGASAPSQPAICLPSIGMAVLRNRFGRSQAIYVPFGPYAGSHSHFDRLAMQVWPWSLDPGTPPYGVEPRRSWYQQTAAHNAIVLDGRSQAPGSGRLLRWSADETGATIELESDALYKQARLHRRIELMGPRLEDRHSVEADSEHSCDYLLHTDRLVELNVEATPASGSLGEEGAYRFITLARSADCKEAISAIVASGGRTYRLTLSASDPCTLLVGEAPGPSWEPTRRRTVLMLHVRGRHTGFVAHSEEVSDG